VVAGGAAYFSAAGNAGRQSYESIFRPGNFFADGAKSSALGTPHFFGGTAHNFKSGGSKDHFQKFTLPGQTTMIFILQWDSPFFSVSGSPGTQNDVDIYVLNSAASQVLSGSVSNNIGNDAIEIIGLQKQWSGAIDIEPDDSESLRSESWINKIHLHFFRAGADHQRVQHEQQHHFWSRQCRWRGSRRSSGVFQYACVRSLPASLEFVLVIRCNSHFI
jgi:hypothetical protein